jgi:hypothetical protein
MGYGGTILDKNPSWEYGSPAAGQKYTQLFMEPEGSLHRSKQPATKPILSQLNLVHNRRHYADSF